MTAVRQGAKGGRHSLIRKMVNNVGVRCLVRPPLVGAAAPG